MPEASVVTNGVIIGWTEVTGNVCCAGKTGAQQSPLPVPMFTARHSFRWCLSLFSCKWCQETAYKMFGVIYTAVYRCVRYSSCGVTLGCVVVFHDLFSSLYRAGRTSEVCSTLLELHQQSKGSPLSPISAWSVPWYGGSNRTGGEI